MAGKLNVKERIVETASRLFYHQGFNSTGINQIISEADIAIGSLYKHFKSKEDLLLYYLKQQETEFFNNLENFLINEQNPKGKLLKLIDYRIQLQQQSNCSGCHFIKINAEIGRKNKDVENIVNEHKQQQRNFINTIILSIEHNSVLNDQQLTNMIFLMIEGAVVSSSIKGSTQDLEDIKSIVSQML
jgi:AcrR family transcriptional regulator